jgi:hypothetical protein
MDQGSPGFGPDAAFALERPAEFTTGRAKLGQVHRQMFLNRPGASSA